MNKTENEELTFIYNSQKGYDKKAKEFLKSVAGFSIKVIDLAKESFSEKKLTDLASKMNVKIEDLLDTNYHERIGVHKEGLNLVNRSEMASLMARDAKLILTPIIFLGNKVLHNGINTIRAPR